MLTFHRQAPFGSEASFDPEVSGPKGRVEDRTVTIRLRSLSLSKVEGNKVESLGEPGSSRSYFPRRVPTQRRPFGQAEVVDPAEAGPDTPGSINLQKGEP